MVDFAVDFSFAVVFFCCRFSFFAVFAVEILCWFCCRFSDAVVFSAVDSLSLLFSL
jgi:hypothetical protein